MSYLDEAKKQIENEKKREISEKEYIKLSIDIISAIKSTLKEELRKNTDCRIVDGYFCYDTYLESSPPTIKKEKIEGNYTYGINDAYNSSEIKKYTLKEIKTLECKSFDMTFSYEDTYRSECAGFSFWGDMKWKRIYCGRRLFIHIIAKW